MTTLAPTILVWSPIGGNRFELPVGKSIGRVERGTIIGRISTTPAWRASIHVAGAPPDQLLEFAWFESRSKAFGWCGARLRPDLSADDAQHLIGDPA